MRDIPYQAHAAIALAAYEAVAIRTKKIPTVTELAATKWGLLVFLWWLMLGYHFSYSRFLRQVARQVPAKHTSPVRIG